MCLPIWPSSACFLTTTWRWVLGVEGRRGPEGMWAGKDRRASRCRTRLVTLEVQRDPACQPHGPDRPERPGPPVGIYSATGLRGWPCEWLLGAEDTVGTCCVWTRSCPQSHRVQSRPQCDGLGGDEALQWGPRWGSRETAVCSQPGPSRRAVSRNQASSTRTSGLQTGEKGRPAIRAPVCAVCHAAGCPGRWLCDPTWAPSNGSGPKPVMMDALRRAGLIPQGEEDPPPITSRQAGDWPL